MKDNSMKRVFRFCPCNFWNIEAIQSWLEDMAVQGLFLEKDGLYWKVFSFERKIPQKVKYRLDVAKKHKSDDESEVTFDEKELYRSMGWDYVLHYGDFNIYRSIETDAPELNTEPETHALTINLLKKKYRGALINAIVWTIINLLWGGSCLFYGFIAAVSVNLLFLLCIYGFIIWLVIIPLVKAVRFRSYEKRLLLGDSITHPVAWKKSAVITLVGRILSIALWCGFAVAIGIQTGLINSSTWLPHEEYTGDPPFATVMDMFSDATMLEKRDWSDYGDYKIEENVLSKNIYWYESCDVSTPDDQNYFCIVRLVYYETASDWIAKKLEKQYYAFDSSGIRGKEFAAIDMPDLGVDSTRVYNSNGSLYVLMRDGNRVVRALVYVDNNKQNEWMLWAQAMAAKLKLQD